MYGLAMGAAVYGTVLGSLIGGWPTDRWDRRPALVAIGVLYMLSAVGCGLAWDVWSFIVARFLGGVGIGVSTVVTPFYISEIAPPARLASRWAAPPTGSLPRCSPPSSLLWSPPPFPGGFSSFLGDDDSSALMDHRDGAGDKRSATRGNPKKIEHDTKLKTSAFFSVGNQL